MPKYQSITLYIVLVLASILFLAYFATIPYKAWRDINRQSRMEEQWEALMK